MTANFGRYGIDPRTIGTGGQRLDATPAEIDQALDGIGPTVTAAALTELTDGSETDLHSHAGGGGGAVVKETVVTLTNAEIKALNSSPKTLVAGVSGRILLFMGGFAKLDTAAGAYTGTAGQAAFVCVGSAGTRGVSTSILGDGDFDGQTDSIVGVHLAQKSDDGPVAVGSADDTYSTFVGQPLTLLGTADFGGGHADNSLRVYLTWIELPASFFA